MWTYWIKKEINRQFSRSQEKRKKRFINYHKTDSITLLLEKADLVSVLPVVYALQKESIKVSLVILGQGDIVTDSTCPGVEFLELIPKEMKFGKRLPDKNAVKKFIGLNTGVLCDLSLTEKLPFMYLASISMAPMKIGLKKKSLNLYDFMIQSSTEITASDLLEKILFYWRGIDIKDNNL